MAFWTRTRRYLTIIWVTTLVAEIVLWELLRRTFDSWVLLLALGLLAFPIIATLKTTSWLGRPKRKRWKKHDLNDAIKAGRDPAEVMTELGRRG